MTECRVYIGDWRGKPVYQMCDNTRCLVQTNLRYETSHEGFWYCSPECKAAIIKAYESTIAEEEDAYE